MTLKTARLQLASLVVLRGILRDAAVQDFAAVLEAEGLPAPARMDRCAAFAARLLPLDGDWAGHLLTLALQDENPYSTACARGEQPGDALEALVQRELGIVEALAGIGPEAVGEALELELPQWWRAGAKVDFAAAHRRRMAELPRCGTGTFAQYTFFRLQEGLLVPVKTPDPVREEDLVGYEREREAVAANTRALLAGRPAANVLLYGDSGTGKSTCVKAVASALAPQGLRLVELRRDQLYELPQVIEQLADNPLRFILFIDDLSFAADGGEYAALKAVLEGSAAAKTANMAIYATSNRRHLVRETFSDRQGDEVHLRDTLEEMSSLSDRFGLLVTFLRPDRALYMDIVRRYLREFGVPAAADTERQAEAFALRRGGRSARAARQFAQAAAAGTNRNGDTI